MRILTVNRHTAYLYLLAHTGHEFCVLEGEAWTSRPLPPNVQILPMAKWSSPVKQFDRVIGHDILRDFPALGLSAAFYSVPYVQVIHGRREGTGHRRYNHIKGMIKKAYSQVLRAVSYLPHAKFVFISPSVQSSWGIRGTVIRPGIPVEEMYAYSGHLQSLLVVGNDLHRVHFDFQALETLKSALPLRVVGRNPRIAGARPAKDWDELRSLFSGHRAYVNITREPENGYNLATLEAMASGMPVVTLRHPTSPIRDGYNGLVAEEVSQLINKARLLLGDLEMARELGANARRTVSESFSMREFVEKWNEVLS